MLLLTVGGLAITAELLTPGLMGPGVVGAICLALAFLGMGQLPVNWVGVGLILFAMILFFLEMQESGVGILGVGGLIAFVIGALLLFGRFFSTPDMSEPGSQASLWMIGSISGLMAAFLLLFIYLSRTSGSSTGYLPGPEGAMTGQLGIAVSDLAPSGKVLVDGKEWRATSDLGRPIQEGEEVRVTGIYGRTLKVSTESFEEPSLEEPSLEEPSLEDSEEKSSLISRLFKKAKR